MQTGIIIDHPNGWKAVEFNTPDGKNSLPVDTNLPAGTEVKFTTHLTRSHALDSDMYYKVTIHRI